MSAHSEMLPPPNNPEAFESLCLELWREIWQDLNAQNNSRNRQAQAGVDIFGQENGKWAGVQCKQKYGLLWSAVSVAELEAEVKKARKFNPPPSAFILATSGLADEKVEQRARELTERSQGERTFSVTVWSWSEIWQQLHRNSSLLESLDPIYWPAIWRTFRKKFGTGPRSRNAVIGGNVTGNAIITRDGNVVEVPQPEGKERS